MNRTRRKMERPMNDLVKGNELDWRENGVEGGGGIKSIDVVVEERMATSGGLTKKAYA